MATARKSDDFLASYHHFTAKRSPLPMSNHAHHRAQKRSVPAQIIEMLQTYGATQRSHGREIWFFDHHARKQIARDFGDAFRQFERWMNVYAVVADNGLVVTVGHRTAKITRH